ncbi:MAG: ABC transporter ATP-binding protein [Flavobacterium sp. BFFFF2]|nr:MAG: ABC transporter ATP-binding protein [Flavobacterium sp. BFFFF2]
MNELVSLHAINKKYGKRQVLHNVSFTIERGEVYGLLGPNGSGKSTTLGIILNVVSATSGTYEWFQGRQTVQQALKKVGALIERPNFYPYLSAWDNLKIVCLIKEISSAAIDEKLKLVGLFDRRNDAFKTYSLGMKQRLAIASALLNNPELLILDEPTNGLDPEGIRHIRDLIPQIASQGTTILLASHLLDEVEKTCSRVLILKEGHLLFDGPVSAVRNAPSYFEIGFEGNAEQVCSIISRNPAVARAKVMAPNRIHVETELTGAALNAWANQQGVVFNHLVYKQQSLEDQFLAITKQ